MIRVRSILTGVPGTPWYVNWYVHGLTNADALQARADAALFWNSFMDSRRTALRVTLEASMPIINPGTGETEGYFDTPTFTRNGGSATGELLPYANQGMVRLITNTVLRSRRVQGRLLFPSPFESECLDGVPTTAYLTFIDTCTSILVNPGAPGRMVVWSRPVKDDAGVIVAPGSEVDITGFSAQPKFSILRSRRD